MKVLLAKSAGFCFGVKRATNMAFEAAMHITSTVLDLGPTVTAWTTQVESPSRAARP
jgi:4-hydroxy-3-methylbut-2-enyl diphosphate reductase